MSVGLHQYRHQFIICDGKYRCDVRICRHNHLVALFHHSHLHIGTQYQRKRIQTVGTSYAMRRADIGCIMLFKGSVFLPLQIPSAMQHTLHSLVYLLLVQRIDFLQTEVINISRCIDV